MIFKQKGRRYYTVKFRWCGKMIQRRTRAAKKKDALDIQATLRSELARGNWGILDAKPRITLAEFLKKEFLPYVESKCAAKPKTADYYKYGVSKLLTASFANLPLEQVTDQHAGQYAARHEALSASTINCGLRTLRRAMTLAAEWGRIARKPKITMAKGERQRERVLTEAEMKLYLDACRQPWKDAATVMLGTGLRPGEVYGLRWEFVLLDGLGGMIHVAEGKSRAARRILPMIPEVYGVLRTRHEAQGKPTSGWVFPTGAICGHLEQGTAKTQHSGAIASANKETVKKNAEIVKVGGKPLPLPLIAFEPYVMRHTALTRMAPHCDPFTLARIAGHSSITITQRYCHPQADAIQRTFEKLASGGSVVTNGGYQLKGASEEQEQIPEVSGS